jgi:hypothetical protein
MTTYNSEIVSVNGEFFDKTATAIEYITNNYADWCGVRFMDTTLVSVEHGDDGNIWVKYTRDDMDYDDNNLSEEPYEIKYHDFVVTLPALV